MLDLLPTQPAEPVPIFALFARLEDLPYYLAALGRAVVNGPGCTEEHLLRAAKYCDDVARECRIRDVRGVLEPEAAAWATLAGILRDCTPHRPHPPRLPANAQDSVATMTRCEHAAGLATCGGAG